MKYIFWKLQLKCWKIAKLSGQEKHGKTLNQAKGQKEKCNGIENNASFHNEPLGTNVHKLNRQRVCFCEKGSEQV